MFTSKIRDTPKINLRVDKNSIINKPFLIKLVTACCIYIINTVYIPPAAGYRAGEVSTSHASPMRIGNLVRLQVLYYYAPVQYCSTVQYCLVPCWPSDFSIRIQSPARCGVVNPPLSSLTNFICEIESLVLKSDKSNSDVIES